MGEGAAHQHLDSASQEHESSSTDNTLYVSTLEHEVFPVYSYRHEYKTYEHLIEWHGYGWHETT
jgi:hypothetical protein